MLAIIVESLICALVSLDNLLHAISLHLFIDRSLQIFILEYGVDVFNIVDSVKEAVLGCYRFVTLSSRHHYLGVNVDDPFLVHVG